MGISYVAAFTPSMYVVQLDSNGLVQWSRTIGSNTLGYSIVLTNDYSYAITGTSSDTVGSGMGDVFVVKLDSTGTLLWSCTIGGTNLDEGYSIVQTHDLGLAITGRTRSFGAGQDDVYIVKLDSAGMLEWCRAVGLSGIDIGQDIVETSNGNFIVVGYTNSFGGGYYDMYFINLDSTGNLLWSTSIGNSTENNYCHSIINTSDSNYVMAGRSDSFGGGAYIVKIDSTGAIIWSKHAGGANGVQAYSILESKTHALVLAGSINNGATDDVALIKLDSSGYGCNILPGGTDINSFGNLSLGGVHSYEFISAQPGPGTVNASSRITNICASPVSVKNLGYRESPFVIYPNPSSKNIQLRFQPHANLIGSNSHLFIYDALGRLMNWNLTISDDAELNISRLVPGVYRVVLVTTDGIYSQSFIKTP